MRAPLSAFGNRKYIGLQQAADLVLVVKTNLDESLGCYWDLRLGAESEFIFKLVYDVIGSVFIESGKLIFPIALGFVGD